MVKRALLAFTFIGIVAASSSALAWSDCGPSYVASYPSYGTYATYPYGSAWAPRLAYYPPVPVRTYPVYYGRSYDRHHHHHDHHNNGLTISFGF